MLNRISKSIKYRALSFLPTRQSRCILLRKIGVRFAPTRVGTIRMWVDLRDGLGQYFFIHQKYESFETELVEKMVQTGMTVVDVGANMGYYTVLFASRIGDTGTVIAIEPDPTNMQLLQRNLRWNHLDNVTCEQAAAMGYEGTTTLYLSNINNGDHRVYNAKDDDCFNQGMVRTAIEVRTIIVDEYLKKESKSPDIVKMDIQGAEMLALSGLRHTLENPNVILLCEFWPYALRQAGTDPIQFLETLSGLGLHLFEILEENRTVKPADLAALPYRFSDSDYANLICVRPERGAQISFLKNYFEACGN
ncbi:MAG: FkbM family methyltransferase [Chloroflexi bacterium]|nr:FkbM family methyltransferase [Chloroflexota bacterium]